MQYVKLLMHASVSTYSSYRPVIDTAVTHLDDKLMFPDDLELSFCSGQLDTSRQLENAITSTVPDVDTGNHDDTAESQDFYQLPTSSKPNRKSRKRTYRDFPNYTNKKPYYGGKS